MLCKLCNHKEICIHYDKIKDFINNSNLYNKVEFIVSECIYNMEKSNIGEAQVFDTDNYDKTEEIIKDFSKRSELIRNSYKDAKGGDIVCPTCKEKVSSLFKCIDCGKPVCHHCGTEVSIDAKGVGMICDECHAEIIRKDDEAQENSIKLDMVDSDFLRDIVREGMPEK